jgi:hypothetical protein
MQIGVSAMIEIAPGAETAAGRKLFQDFRRPTMSLYDTAELARLLGTLERPLSPMWHLVWHSRIAKTPRNP